MATNSKHGEEHDVTRTGVGILVFRDGKVDPFLHLRAGESVRAGCCGSDTTAMVAGGGIEVNAAAQ